MNVHVPGQPKHLRVTQTMIEDLLWDPVMAAKVLMGVDLDVFQAVRLRFYWFVPAIIDSSGLSSMKTNVWWIYCQLRAILLSDHRVATVYQNFSTGKEAFWSLYDGGWAAHPIFQAQIGKVDVSGKEGKANKRDPSVYTCYFRNGSKVQMPAGNWLQEAKGLASMRWNTAGLDEWTKIEETGTEGINRQFLGRITRANWNKRHPIWANHTKFLATAESQGHPAWKRYKTYLERAAKGNPNVACISFNFKDYSDKVFPPIGKSYKELFRDQNAMDELKANFDPDHYRREALGVWSQSGSTWYSKELLDQAQELNEMLGYVVENRAFEQFEFERNGD